MKMKGIFLAVLTAITTISIVSEAQYRPYPGPQPRPPRPPERRPDNRGDEEIRINRYFRYQGSIDLMREMDLERRHFGRRIRDVIIVANVIDHGRRNGRAIAELVSERGPLGSPVSIFSSQYSQQYSLLTRFGPEIGRDLRDLRVELRDDMRGPGRRPYRDNDILVESVIVRFERGGGGHGPGDQDTIMRPVNQQVYMGAVLDLNYILNLDSRDQRRIESVIVVARSTSREAFVQVSVNDMFTSYAERLDWQTREFRMPLQNDLGGRFGRNLKLHVRGDAVIEAVGVRFSRF